MQESFAESFDGTRLFYELGAPARTTPPLDAYLCDGVGCDGFVWRYLRPCLASQLRVIHPHMRGHGRSAPPVDPSAIRIPHLVEDTVTVLDACGSERAVLFGHSMGVQVALETWHRHPHRVAGLVLLCGSYENPVGTFRNGPALTLTLPVLRAVAHGLPTTVANVWRTLLPTPMSYAVAELTEINGDLVRRSDFVPYLEHLARMDPRVFLDMVAAAGAHSASHYLGSIDVPVLVISGEKDQFTPAWLSEQMGRRIPTAAQFVISEGTHTAPIEQPTLVNHRVGAFFADQLGVTLDLGAA